MWKLQLFELNFDQREVEAVKETVESGWLTMGERISEFEKNFSTFIGGDTQCLAVSNGTAALHMALIAVGVRPGDEVIIPALTFVADANVVRMIGAIPVLADCGSMENWNITAASISSKLTSRTRAVIAVHYAGYPCDMPSISMLCREMGISLIEDVAHAPGAAVAGTNCGAWGDIGCFSFFSNKNLSIGEGGMVSTSNPELLQRLRHLRSHGMSTLTLDRHKGRAITYDVAEVGLNYRMDEMRASIGLVQLEKLPAGNERRKILTEAYRGQLEGSGVTIPFSQMPEDYRSAYHILPILLPGTADRNMVISGLKERGIQSSIHYPPFWNFSAYADQFSAQDAPLTARICDHELTLPLFPTMRDTDVEVVTAALLECLQ